MRASLDTNVIIHLYRAGLQSILFEIFEDGVLVYEQIRNVELERHGKEVLKRVDDDIALGRIQIYTIDKLKEQGVHKIFEYYVKDNRYLYDSGDLGEVYAISLAQTLGAYSVVTDDTKQGGPYMSLLNLNYDVMPFNFVDLLILRYLLGIVDQYQTVEDFNAVNSSSKLNWSFKSKLRSFIRRFFKDPYKEEDKQWMKEFNTKNNIDIKKKLFSLSQVIEN